MSKIQVNIWKIAEGFELSVVGDDCHFSAKVLDHDTDLISLSSSDRTIEALTVGMGRMVVGNQSLFGLYLFKDEEYGTTLIRDPRSQFINHYALAVEVEKTERGSCDWEAKCYEIDAFGKGKSLEEALDWLVISASHFGIELNEKINESVRRYLARTF